MEETRAMRTCSEIYFRKMPLVGGGEIIINPENINAITDHKDSISILCGSEWFNIEFTLSEFLNKIER